MGYIVGRRDFSMFTSLLFKGGAILLLVTACLFFAWRIVRILNPRPPRPPKYTEYFVVEVKNGATIIVAKSIGKRRSRRTKSLNLEGVASPAEGEQWFAESRDNLKLFAGAKVRVQVRGLFRSEKPEEETFMVWFEKHYDGCKICSSIPTPENPEPLLCEEAKARMEKAVESDDPEIRDGVVGTVWGESGACLNLEQLKSGWAKSVGKVSEEWADAEKEAKKTGMGIWKE